MKPFVKMGIPRILCVEEDPAVRESQSAALQSSGYHAFSASPKLAEMILSCQPFDLIVLSTIDEYALNRIINVADRAEILSLEHPTMPSDMLRKVEEKLRHWRERRR
jgi:hypothetical protein